MRVSIVNQLIAFYGILTKKNAQKRFLSAVHIALDIVAIKPLDNEIQALLSK